MSNNRVSRRQFLNYTLMGVGGFMAAGVLMPMVRFAVDPVLKAGAEGDFIATKVKVADITNEPQRVDFTFDQVDAWYESEVTGTAWVFKDENGELSLYHQCASIWAARSTGIRMTRTLKGSSAHAITAFTRRMERM